MPKEKSRLKSRKKLGGYKTKMHTHDKWFPPEVPDVSDEPDELFAPPFHSTAISYEEGELEKDQYSEHEEPNSELDAPVTPRQVVKRDHTEKSQGQLAIKSSQKERENSASEVVKENMMPRTSAKSPVQQEKESPGLEANTVDPDDDTTHLVKIWRPSGFPSRVTELDVILDEFEKVTAQYKQGVKMKICRRAIDTFYIGVRDQLVNTSTGAEELRRTKLRSAKMVGKINKKRLHLIEVKEELIRTEPQLKKLQRECADLKEKISSLRNAVKLLNTLKDLRHEYAHNQKKNPQGKVIYGVHSLPALLMESWRILGAESHFQNINSKLQQVLDLQNE